MGRNAPDCVRSSLLAKQDANDWLGSPKAWRDMFLLFHVVVMV